MEKNDDNSMKHGTPAEAGGEPPPKWARRPIVPSLPMTDEERQALLELMAMMQITPDEWSEKRYQELHSLWA